MVVQAMAFNTWKGSKYGVICGPYFPEFISNTGKCRLEKTPYLETFHAVRILLFWNCYRIEISVITIKELVSQDFDLSKGWFTGWHS